MPPKDRKQRPAKPYAGFPLTPHPAGQWVKRIAGKLRYFGKWDDPEGALENYVRFRDGGGGVTNANIDMLTQRFVHSHRLKVDAGSRSEAGHKDYRKECRRLVAHFGGVFPLEKINAWHLEQYRATWPTTWSAKTVESVIARTRAILNYAYAQDLVDKPIRMGSAMDRPERRQIELERAAKPQRYFERHELHSLLECSSGQVTAMIYLGLNAAFGNADVGRLRWKDINFASQWYSNPREKTGEWRECWLWPETIAELEKLTTPRNGLVFITKHGNPWFTDGANRSPLTLAFSRLTTAAGCRRKGVNFYSLRHVFQTIAEDAADPVAVKIVMGHRDNSMSANYRNRINPDRIRAVCGHVREWFLSESK